MVQGAGVDAKCLANFEVAGRKGPEESLAPVFQVPATGPVRPSHHREPKALVARRGGGALNPSRPRPQVAVAVEELRERERERESQNIT